MSMYSKFKTDSALEQSGVKIEYGDFRVTVARAGGSNKKYQRALEAKTRPLRRAIATEAISAEKQRALLHEVYAESVVLNWEVLQGEEWVQGIEDAEGEIIEFNSANVLMTFKNLPDLFADIQEQAGLSAIFRQDIAEASAGN